MNNPQKKPNSAGDELAALRQELSEFRKDFAKFNQELSLKVTFGIIAAIILYYLAIGFFSVFALFMH